MCEWWWGRCLGVICEWWWELCPEMMVETPIDYPFLLPMYLNFKCSTLTLISFLLRKHCCPIVVEGG